MCVTRGRMDTSPSKAYFCLVQYIKFILARKYFEIITKNDNHFFQCGHPHLADSPHPLSPAVWFWSNPGPPLSLPYVETSFRESPFQWPKILNFNLKLLIFIGYFYIFIKLCSSYSNITLFYVEVIRFECKLKIT